MKFKKYKYTALKDNKDLVSGITEASDERDARENIREIGYLPVEIHLDGVSGKSTSYKHVRGIRLRVSEKRLFATSLQSMLESGIPIIEALSTIEQEGYNDKIRKIAGSMAQRIRQGSTFTAALEEYQNAFGNLFIKLCNAGEMSGELDKVLLRLVKMLKKQEEILSKLLPSVLYLSGCALVGLFIAMFGVKLAIPALLSLYQFGGVPIPLHGQLLVDTFAFINNYWFISCILCCGLLYGIIEFFKLPFVQRAISKFLLNLSGIGTLVRYTSLANFISVLQVAYESGIPMPEAVKMASLTVDNVVMREKAELVEEFLNQGLDFTDSIKRADIMPFDMVPIFAVGEKSGRLGDMLEDASATIDRNIDSILDSIPGLFHLLGIVILGILTMFLLVGFWSLYGGSLRGLGSF